MKYIKSLLLAIVLSAGKVYCSSIQNNCYMDLDKYIYKDLDKYIEFGNDKEQQQTLPYQIGNNEERQHTLFGENYNTNAGKRIQQTKKRVRLTEDDKKQIFAQFKLVLSKYKKAELDDATAWHTYWKLDGGQKTQIHDLLKPLLELKGSQQQATKFLTHMYDSYITNKCNQTNINSDTDSKGEMHNCSYGDLMRDIVSCAIYHIYCGSSQKLTPENVKNHLSTAINVNCCTNIKEICGVLMGFDDMYDDVLDVFVRSKIQSLSPRKPKNLVGEAILDTYTTAQAREIVQLRDDGTITIPLNVTIEQRPPTQELLQQQKQKLAQETQRLLLLARQQPLLR